MVTRHGGPPLNLVHVPVGLYGLILGPCAHAIPLKIRIEAQGQTIFDIPAFLRERRHSTQRERVGWADDGASRVTSRSVRESIATSGPAEVPGATFSPVGIARNRCCGRAVLCPLAGRQSKSDGPTAKPAPDQELFYLRPKTSNSRAAASVLGGEMLLLHSAGCAVGEARLPAERVEALVGLRCAARTARDYAAADALKIELEAGGVKLQDEVDGSTSWRYKLLQPRMGGGSRMMELARRAVDEHEHEHTLISISTDALALCLGDEPLLGRTAADAAFEFALAGSASSELIDALAEAQSLEFRRWKKPQPLVTMQVCERLAASGIADTSPIFDHAVSVLRTGGEECSHAMRSVQELSFEHPRSLRWLWRRAAVLRKELPPTNEVGHGSLHVALNAFSKPELPLVVDLGCGFGTSLLSLSRPRQAIGAAHAPVLGRYNLLGCDASSLKTAYANGAARRWGTFESTQFARASAEMTLASAFSSLASRLAGVVVQLSLIHI